jgi:hypothetical protein
MERKQTNGDRIRAMSNEELAYVLDYCPGNCKKGYRCTDCLTEWLEQPVEDEDER